MFPAQFEYHRATSVGDALSLLGRLGEDAKLIAGGHSLLPMMKLRLGQPAHLIDLAGIRGLAFIKEASGKIGGGAATTHNQIETSELARAKLGLLAECAAAIGDVQVRNRGTIGGSLAHADPAADYPAAVLALEAEMVGASARGRRVAKAADWFRGRMTTALASDELLVEILVTAPRPGTGAAYLK